MDTKKILVTAGTVYGPLDDNKLVGNRVRGVWATRFAQWLHRRGHDVQLLVADIQREQISDIMNGYYGEFPDRIGGRIGTFDVITHKGFWDYQEQCVKLAAENDAAVMAAAVVNWIPAKPFKGKMSTTSLRELGSELSRAIAPTISDGDVPIPGKTIVDIPFILAPRVIDQMRRTNPKLTLIGCKLTIGATRDAMIEAAYHTLVGAKCHAVVANDLLGLRAKSVLYPDRATFEFDIGAEEGINFYKHLEAIITDEHFTTVGVPAQEAYAASELSNWRYAVGGYQECEDLFELIAEKYRDRFVRKGTGTDKVFGAIAVRTGTGAICTPREKTVLAWTNEGEMFWKRDAVDVLYPTDDDLNLRRTRVIQHGESHALGEPVPKATMNATLLLRQLQQHPSAAAVLHLHEFMRDWPTVPYAPPGTARDNLRSVVLPAYNIEGHGCIVLVDEEGELYGKWAQ